MLQCHVCSSCELAIPLERLTLENTVIQASTSTGSVERVTTFKLLEIN